MIQLLIENDADIDAVDLKGQTPLHHAVRRCHKSAVKLLLAHGADITVANKDGLTPLAIASRPLRCKECALIIKMLRWYNGEKEFN